MDALRAPDGGFTLRQHLGDGPRTGYMVSYAGSEEAIPDTVSRADLSDHIDRYLAQHKAAIDADPNMYFGGWHAQGKLVLDRSQHFDDEDAARTFGIATPRSVTTTSTIR